MIENFASREMVKFDNRVTKEAREYGKQSFNYAFLLDQNPEEVKASFCVTSRGSMVLQSIWV